MDSEYFPKLDTSEETLSNSARNSYASATDSDSRSARNSYTPTSDTTASTRTSYSSLPESFSRVESFSRTTTILAPDSDPNTPLDPDQVLGEQEWNNEGTDEMRSGEEAGFGTRLTVSSAENEENTPAAETASNSKPIPKDGPSALKELQNVRNIICVAFGAFDRYFISWEDNEGEFHQESQKLPQCLNNWLFPSSGETRDLQTLQVSLGSNDEFFASDKNGKLSSRDAICQLGEKRVAPRLAEITRGIMRQKSYTVSSPTLPEDLRSKLDEKSAPKMERRKTYQLGQDIMSPKSTADVEITPRVGLPQLLRLEKRRSTQLGLESPLERTVVETPVREEPVQRQLSKVTTIPFEENKALIRLDTEPETRKANHARRKSLMIPVPPVRAAWPKKQILSIAREKLQTREPQISPPAKARSYVDASVQTEILEDLSLSVLGLQAMQTPRYVEPHFNQLPPQHLISIGSMQDFCRGQYRLGDALGTFS